VFVGRVGGWEGGEGVVEWYVCVKERERDRASQNSGANSFLYLCNTHIHTHTHPYTHPYNCYLSFATTLARLHTYSLSYFLSLFLILSPSLPLSVCLSLSLAFSLSLFLSRSLSLPPSFYLSLAVSCFLSLWRARAFALTLLQWLKSKHPDIQETIVYVGRTCTFIAYHSRYKYMEMYSYIYIHICVCVHVCVHICTLLQWLKSKHPDIQETIIDFEGKNRLLWYVAYILISCL